MRCIFCKEQSSLSRSVEHIVPESLGNTTHILPPGVVCDRCNNYFAREVEKPFIDTPYITQLRFHEMLENKRGRVPLVQGLIGLRIPVSIERSIKDRIMRVDVPSQFVEDVSRLTSGRLYSPRESSPPSGTVLSRFLAKVAVESLAQRLLETQSLLDDFIDEARFDAIRGHARRGTTPIWPTNSRRIYSADVELLAASGGQVIHESDLLITSLNEIYFIWALFGQEFVINMGGPDIEGYSNWLIENGGKSPLYAGNNASTS